LALKPARARSSHPLGFATKNIITTSPLAELFD
jgi:hypothetical protein